MLIKKLLFWLNQFNINWLSSLKLNSMPQFLGCFVKCFHFVWCKIIITSSCQKCLGEGVSIVVPTWWAVSITKVGMGTATGWRVVVNGKVPAPSENRSIRRDVVYGMTVIVTILPCLRQSHRCPSWLVNQREKKWLGIISVPVANCWENKKWKGWSDAQTSLKIQIYNDYDL